ncbi:hypothetical protein PAECIP111890_02101 [Paenibacillus sp. JJ-223]|nr:hypothetical protein PAECIP111890_02101 [Paenibacillus sp. JJ-223]
MRNHQNIGGIRDEFYLGKSPQEAYQNPYEYEAQNQFYRETSKLLKLLFEHMIKNQVHMYVTIQVLKRLFGCYLLIL